MNVTIHPAKPLQGSIEIPPDKAIGHRAVLLAALAEGATTLHPWPKAEDCRRTREAVESCGVQTRVEGESLVIEGRGLYGLSAPAQPVFCGESGTTLRLIAGLLAGQTFASTLEAAPSLRARPMRRILDPLCSLGAKITGASGVKAGECYPPLQIAAASGKLKGGRCVLDVASAQVKSAVLLAGLYADGPLTVVEKAPTRDHTERMLQRFGMRLRQSGPEITLEPGIPVSPGEIRLPGDCSSAAFFIVAGTIVPGSEILLNGVGVNPTRSHYLKVLERMGADVAVTATEDCGEPVAALRVRSKRLSAVTLSADEVPLLVDEIPILMVAAAVAEGRSVFPKLHELRVKETDRVSAMAAILTAFGARVELADEDTVIIEGGQSFKAAVVSGHGDHRMAMSAAVAALVAGGRSTIEGAECVSKSFPEFFEQLAALAPV